MLVSPLDLQFCNVAHNVSLHTFMKTGNIKIEITLLM